MSLTLGGTQITIKWKQTVCLLAIVTKYGFLHYFQNTDIYVLKCAFLSFSDFHCAKAYSFLKWSINQINIPVVSQRYALAHCTYGI